MGASRPFGGRLRLGLESQFRWLASGQEGVDQIRIAEQRATLDVAWAPNSRLFFLARLPFVRRELELSDFSEATLAHVGDMELLARWYIYRDREFQSKHLFFVSGGLEIPTAPFLRPDDGDRLGFETQIGSGSFDPLLGLGYTYVVGDLSSYTSARVLVPTEGYLGARSGVALRASSLLQWQAHPRLGVRGGVDLRWESSIVEDDQEDPHSGGTGIFFTPDLIWAPWTDIILRAAVSIPVIMELRGVQSEGPTIRVGVVIDV